MSKPGYVRIDLQGLSMEGNSFGEVKQLVAANVSGKSSYVTNFADYWGRRGPSVHLPTNCRRVIPSGSTTR